MAGPRSLREDESPQAGEARVQVPLARDRERVFRHAPDPTGKAAPPKSNGGPRVYAEPIDELRDIGTTLYASEAWIPRLARDLGEHARQVRRWDNGEAKVPPIVLHRARITLREHMRRMRKLLVRLGMEET